MRHILKTEKCQDFEDYIIDENLEDNLDKYIRNKSKRKHPWKLISGAVKRKLAGHLLKEQKGLCVYCQQSLILSLSNKVLSDISHIEHIKPKSRNKFPQETFNHNNLVLSCNGFDCKGIDKSREFCGHRKEDEYQEEYFLNPVDLFEIENYFKYSFEGKIKPNQFLDKEAVAKAEYMIRVLDLEHDTLTDLRSAVYLDILTYTESDIRILLDEENEILIGFHSMLKQLFNP